MSADPELHRLLRDEQDAEANRAQAHRLEARRHAGVAWSGLGPDPLPRRSPADLALSAEARLDALHHWRRSAPGRLLAAMAQAERAVETIRACVARGLTAVEPRCGLAIDDLDRAAALARSAMDAAASGVQSDRPCATNIASGNPSTT